MDFREALQAGKIGIGGASDHWSRLFGQKVLGGYAEGYAEGPIASFTDGVNAPVDNLLVAITPVQTGTGDPSPENVRPISGWTGANVTRTGVNTWDEFTERGNINSTTGNDTAASNFLRTGFIPVKPETSYFFHSDESLRCRYYDLGKNYIGYIDKNGRTNAQNNSRTMPDDCYYLRFAYTATEYGNDISVNYPDTDTAYHAYTGGTTYPITFPSEAGTVYGGELDVTTGVLTVDSQCIAVTSDMNWSRTAGTDESFWYTSLSRERLFENDAENQFRSYGCSHFPLNFIATTTTVIGCRAFYSSGSNQQRLIFRPDGIASMTLSDWKSFLDQQVESGTPVQFVARLATPLTYQLTPTEVTTLLGVNNVWADTGDVKVWYKKKK